MQCVEVLGTVSHERGGCPVPFALTGLHRAGSVLTAVRVRTLTSALTLLLSVAWRWRGGGWVAGGSLALVISLEIFLSPLVVCLAATRRCAAATPFPRELSMAAQ